MVQARPPKKGKSILHLDSVTDHRLPHDMLKAYAKCRGSQVATRYAEGFAKWPMWMFQMTFMIMLNILDEVGQMVVPLPMLEVTQPVLNEGVRKLAAAAFPDPGQYSLWTYYVRAATGLLRQILKDNYKVIVEVTFFYIIFCFLLTCCLFR